MKKSKTTISTNRRKFIASFLGVIGFAIFGLGLFDYMKNPKKIFKSDYFKNGRFKNVSNVSLSLLKPGQLLSDNEFTMNSKWWEDA